MNPVYSVTKITQYIKTVFLRDAILPKLTVEGEVSNLKYHSTGNVFFTLKDSGAQLKCTMFRDARYSGLTFPMKEGDKVQVSGRIGVFERDGIYQLYAEQIVRAGLGELYERFEKLKKQLYAEGLFDEAHKKPIPLYPKRIGIVTSKTGAAIRDIETVLRRRNPYVQPVLAPALVQGEGAAASIVRAIQRLIRAGVDVIIVGRGGGSLEDLWAFNEECVARAVYACPIPVISCVGHETDTTVIDYVSDLRAPTPSAAAELAVRESDEILARLVDYHSELTGMMTERIERARDEVTHLRRLLSYQKPDARLQRRKEQHEAYKRRLRVSMETVLSNRKHMVSVYAARLDGVSPLKKLGNGFGYVTHGDGKPLRSATLINLGDRISVTLPDGKVEAEVTKISPAYSFDREE